MQLAHLNFRTWSNQHKDDHDSKWCRELYPYEVFNKINFDPALVNIQQEIQLPGSDYIVVIKDITLQDNGRYRATFDLNTTHASEFHRWQHRTWNTTFRVVYSLEGHFITVFAKNEDPSKDYVSRFMRGSFERIHLNKSLPISSLLFRTLLLHTSEVNFPGGKHNEVFPCSPEGIRDVGKPLLFGTQQTHFFPLYSVGRKVWVTFSFTEEKAHRLALQLANQCETLYVVFCNPTFTKHHRCSYPSTFVLSLYGYSNLFSDGLRLQYAEQIRFLQTQLNLEEAVTPQAVLNEIYNPQKEVYEIQQSDIMEALGIIKQQPVSEAFLFHCLAAANLLNAWISQNRKKPSNSPKQLDLFKQMYSFKADLTRLLSKAVENLDSYKDTRIFVQDNLIYVETLGLQFSYHSVALNDILRDYQCNERNKEIIWANKRLQPIAPLILQYARLINSNKPPKAVKSIISA